MGRHVKHPVATFQAGGGLDFPRRGNWMSRNSDGQGTAGNTPTDLLNIPCNDVVSDQANCGSGNV